MRTSWPLRVMTVVAMLAVASVLSGISEARSQHRRGEAAAEAALRHAVTERLSVEPTFELLRCQRDASGGYRCRVAFTLGDVDWSGRGSVAGGSAASSRRFKLSLLRSKDLCGEEWVGGCEARVHWSSSVR